VEVVSPIAVVVLEALPLETVSVWTRHWVIVLTRDLKVVRFAVVKVDVLVLCLVLLFCPAAALVAWQLLWCVPCLAMLSYVLRVCCLFNDGN
jgi:ABC-type siderophore export system fused ATPase/permease subunit